jgi:hypothetical protein
VSPTRRRDAVRLRAGASAGHVGASGLPRYRAAPLDPALPAPRARLRASPSGAHERVGCGAPALRLLPHLRPSVRRGLRRQPQKSDRAFLAGAKETFRVLRAGGVLACVFPGYYSFFGGSHLEGYATSIPGLNLVFTQALRSAARKYIDRHGWTSTGSPTGGDGQALEPERPAVRRFHQLWRATGYDRCTSTTSGYATVAEAGAATARFSGWPSRRSKPQRACHLFER